MCCQRPLLLVAFLGFALSGFSGCGSPGTTPPPRDEREKRVLGGGPLDDHGPRDPGPGVSPGEGDPGPGQPPSDTPPAIPYIPDPVSPRVDEPEGMPPLRNEGGLPLDMPATEGELRTVQLAVQVADPPARAAVVLLGFRAVDITSTGALKPGRRPAWFWSSDPMQISAALSVEARLPEELALFALLDEDADLTPDRGECMSIIDRDFALPAEGATATFTIDRRFSAP